MSEDRAKRDCELVILSALRRYEKDHDAVVESINFKRQAMCDTDGQYIKTWDIFINARRKVAAI